MVLEGVAPATPVIVSGDNGNTMWDNPFMMLIWLSVLGRGGFGFGGAGEALSTDFLYTNLSAGQREIQYGLGDLKNGICDLGYALGKDILEAGYRNDIAIANQTATIVANANSNTREILDKICASEMATLRGQLCAAQDGLVEARILGAINGLPKAPAPAYVVPGPFCGTV